ncbi:MAG: tRNA(Ile)-lysidine synthase, partial [bacterium]
ETAKEIGANCIVTAHNMNDQAETFLMRLIRGAGITGLTGIKPILKMSNSLKNPHNDQAITISRPLLNTKRSDIESYLREKQLSACIDSSNFSTKLTRNKIRLDILPKISTINPKAIEAISRTTDMLREWQEVFIDNSPSQLINSKDNEIKLSLDTLLNIPEVMRHQKLRDSIEQIYGKIHGITAKHIISIDSLLVDGKSGKKILLPNNLEVAREFEHIIIRTTANLIPSSDNNTNNIDSFDLPINSYWVGKLFTLSYQIVTKLETSNYPRDMFTVLDLDKIGEKLKVRFRLPGDKYLPTGHKNPEKLKRLMLEKRIPLSERKLWPLVITPNNEIIWAPKLPLAAEFAANSKSSHFAII